MATQPTDHHTLLTVKEAATVLKLNPLTVYDYIKQGKLKAAQFGRYYRIHPDDLSEFIKQHAVIAQSI